MLYLIRRHTTVIREGYVDARSRSEAVSVFDAVAEHSAEAGSVATTRHEVASWPEGRSLISGVPVLEG